MNRRKRYKLFSTVSMSVGVVLFLVFAFSIGRQFGYIGDSFMVAVAAGTLNVGANDGLMVSSGWFFGSNSSLVAWLPQNDRGVLVIPLWLPILLTLSASWAAWCRSHKPTLGHCAKCAYNL